MLAVGSSMLVTFSKKLMCAMLGIIVAVWHQQSHGSLMVTALGRPPNQAVWTQTLAGDIVLTRHFTLTVPLSTLVYKWIPANLILGATLACHPGRLYRNTPLLVTSSCTESGINFCLMGHLACICMLRLYMTDNLTLCQHSPLCVPMI